MKRFLVLGAVLLGVLILVKRRFSGDYDLLIWDASSKWSVPFEWVKAVIGAESDFNPKAYRAEPKINDASYGLMQLLYKTARGLGYQGPPEGLYDPAVNIDLGTHLLSDLRRAYGDDFERVYSAYNSGRPDLFRTSSTVAAHVKRAVDYLQGVLSGATVVSG